MRANLCVRMRKSLEATTKHRADACMQPHSSAPAKKPACPHVSVPAHLCALIVLAPSCAGSHMHLLLMYAFAAREADVMRNIMLCVCMHVSACAGSWQERSGGIVAAVAAKGVSVRLWPDRIVVSMLRSVCDAASTHSEMPGTSTISPPECAHVCACMCVDASACTRNACEDRCLCRLGRTPCALRTMAGCRPKQRSANARACAPRQSRAAACFFCFCYPGGAAGSSSPLRQLGDACEPCQEKVVRHGDSGSPQVGVLGVSVKLQLGLWHKLALR